MHINISLLHWFKTHARELPWKQDRDPYKIWVSEILLQQTRVEQAWDYYIRFIDKFPFISDLASSPMDDLLRLWQGLGYYSRARNMHFAANQVMHEYNGTFPSEITEIAKLKGVGPYTAAAIAAFAFDIPVVAVDGNVFRIMSRLFCEDTPIDTESGRKIFTALSKNCLASAPAAVFNQALMDFGSLVCTPVPHCDLCPLATQCLAYLQNRVQELPVKKKKAPPRARYLYYLHITEENDTFIEQRIGKDIWQNLYQFPLIEENVPLTPDLVCTLPQWGQILGNSEFIVHGYSPLYVHRLTHQILHTYFIRISIVKSGEALNKNYRKISSPAIDDYGIPRVMEQYLYEEPVKYSPNNVDK